MKKLILNLALTALVAGTIFIACKKVADEMKDDTETENVMMDEKGMDMEDDMDTDVNAEYTAYKTESEAKIKENESIIDILKGDVKKTRQELRAGYNNTVNELEERNEAMKERLKNYKQETKEGLQSFSREFNRDMEELGQALRDLGKNNIE